MEQVAFFDLEISTSPKPRLLSIGAWFQGRAWHSQSVHDFEQFQQEAKFLCGHNVLAHDLPYLKNAGASDNIFRKQVIDTLYLSPLFFPNRPYHRLIKDYRLMSDYFNNPVEDSKIAADLLEDCIAAYFNLPVTLRDIFMGLLGNEKVFSSFFSLLGEDQAIYEDLLELYIYAFFEDRICTNVKLQQFIAAQPVPLAYALALINAPDQGSIIPPWLLHQFPEIVTVLQQLRGTSCQQTTCAIAKNISRLWQV